MSLMYGSDDNYVTRYELMNLEMRQQGARHNPTSFYEFASRVVHAFDSAGYVVKEEEYALTKDGGTFFGTLRIDTTLIGELDFDPIVGMRGSHVQKLARGLLIGESVIVCSNLCFHGDLGNWKTKQTTNSNRRYADMIKAAVDTLPALVEDRNALFDKMKDTRYVPRGGDAKLVDLWRKGGLSGYELTRALEEWMNPSFDHGDEFTLWRLFNAATQALKPTGETVNMDTVSQRSRIISDDFKRMLA